MGEGINTLSEIVNAFDLATDQSTEAKFYANDLLGTETVSPTLGTTVFLHFIHQMARVTLTLPKTTTDMPIILKTVNTEGNVTSTKNYTPWMSQGEKHKVYTILVKPTQNAQIAWTYDDEGIQKETASNTMHLSAGINYSYGVSAAKVDETLAVDMGLPSGTKWAPFNVGAEIEGGMTEAEVMAASKQVGVHYSWGETLSKSVHGQAKYLDPSYTWAPINGSIIGTEHDVAHVNWGGDWVMPSKADYEELKSNCSFSKEGTVRLTISGTTKDYDVVKITSKKNSNYIYIVACGYIDAKPGLQNTTGYYSTGNASTTALKDQIYYRVTQSGLTQKTDGSRYTGMLIRPVLKVNTALNSVKTTITSNPVDMGSAGKWAAVNVGAEEDLKNEYSSVTASNLIDYGKTTLGWRAAWGETEKGTGFGKTGDNVLFDWIHDTDDHAGNFNHHIIKDMVQDIQNNTTYDMAAAQWTGGWQIPTATEWQELIDACNITSDWTDGDRYYTFTLKTDESKKLHFRANGYIRNQIFYSQQGTEGLHECWFHTANSTDESLQYQKAVHIYMDGETPKAEIITEIKQTNYKPNGMMVRAVKKYN